MASAYVDTSALLAVLLHETNGPDISRRLGGFDRLASSNLLEAEVRVAFARENLEFDPQILSGIEWVFPEFPLSQQFAAVLSSGYLRGADLWHVATALYTFPEPGGASFITLDRRQQTVAAALGFSH